MQVDFCIPIWIDFIDPPFQGIISSISTKGLKIAKDFLIFQSCLHCVANVYAVLPVSTVKCLCSRGREWGREGGKPLQLEGGRQNLRQLNCSFTNISSHFSAIYIQIFHKTEVQTVILRCWMGLYLNWFSSYGPKRENFRFRFLLIL